MDAYRTTRERRMEELRELQQANPRALIDLYCKITGQPTSSQLPRGASFSSMIEAIVVHEAAHGPLSHTTT